MPIKPLVSFCIPVHNSDRYLEQTIQAILLQNYERFEIVAVNDHSTDRSEDILRSYSDRLIYFQADKRGAAAARNQAFNNCNGQYIIFFDSDDLILPDFLSSQISKIKGDNNVVLSKWGRFYGNAESFIEDSNIVRRDMSFYEWIVCYWTYNNHTTPPGRLLIPRPLVEKSGLWNEELNLNDDLDFFSNVFYNSDRIYFNEDVAFYYRSGVEGLSSKIKTYAAQLSNFKAIRNAISLALLKYPGDPKIAKACANMWQSFIYQIYPYHSALSKEAEKEIENLGGADYLFPSGGVTKVLAQVIGWKMAKKFKKVLSKDRW